jgi:hypothetical protein
MPTKPGLNDRPFLQYYILLLIMKARQVSWKSSTRLLELLMNTWGGHYRTARREVCSPLKHIQTVAMVVMRAVTTPMTIPITSNLVKPPRPLANVLPLLFESVPEVDVEPSARLDLLGIFVYTAPERDVEA